MSSVSPPRPSSLIHLVSNSGLPDKVSPMTPGQAEVRPQACSSSDSEGPADELTSTSSPTPDNSSTSLFLGKGSRSISRTLSGINLSSALWKGVGQNKGSSPRTDARSETQEGVAKSGRHRSRGSAAASTSALVASGGNGDEADEGSDTEEALGDSLDDLSSDLETSSRGGLAEARSSLELNVQQLTELAGRMRQGIKIKDRMYRLKKYTSCFVGLDAVQWLIRSGAAADESEAILLGNQMLQLGLLYHVKYKHAFENRFLFYRFYGKWKSLRQATSGHTSPQRGHAVEGLLSLMDESWSKSVTGAVPLRGTSRGSRWTPSAEVTRLQRRVAHLSALLEEIRKEGRRSSCDMHSELLGQLSRHARLLQDQAARLTTMEKKFQGLDRNSRLLLCINIILAVYVAVALSMASSRLLDHFGGVVTFGVQAPARPITGLLLIVLLLALAWAGLPLRNLLRRLRTTLRGPRPAVPPQAALAEQPKLTAEREIPLPLPAAAAEPLPEPSTDVALPAGRDQGEALPPTLDDFRNWADAPVLLRPDPRLPYIHIDPGALDGGRIAANVFRPIQFSTEDFEGRAFAFVRGLGSTPEEVFMGKKRRSVFIVQGRFKRPLHIGSLVTGPEFRRPLKHLPVRWLVEGVLMKMARQISPSVDIGPLNALYVLAPLLAMCNTVNVSLPGQEPAVTALKEDLLLFDPSLVSKDGSPMNPEKRKRHFSSLAELGDRTFTQEHVWTFEMCQQYIDMSRYELEVLQRFDLTRHLDGQPLQFMLKDRESGRYLINLEIWNESLLSDAQAAAAATHS
eukprot:jgi/Botrbrau1/10009/Bobra.0012s0097.1